MLNRTGPRWAAAILALVLAGSSPAQAQMRTPRAEIIKELRTLPVFAVLETHYPAAFSSAIDAVEKGAAAGRSMRDMQSDIRDAYAALLKTQMPKAEGAIVLEAARMARDQAETLSSSPRDCMVILGYAKMDRVMQAVLTPAQINAEQKWAAEMLRQTATRPVQRKIAMPPDRTVQVIALTAYDALGSDDARRRIGRMAGRFAGVTDTDDQRAICEFSIQFMNAILDMPPNEAVDAFLGLNYAADQNPAQD